MESSLDPPPGSDYRRQVELSNATATRVQLRTTHVSGQHCVCIVRHFVSFAPQGARRTMSVTSESLTRDTLLRYDLGLGEAQGNAALLSVEFWSISSFAENVLVFILTVCVCCG